MKKIDRETVQRIIDTADIVDVVSDFVTLKRRGANYMGLCPFHSERTPSFSVSKSKGICKCFSCGKGGSPVSFLMELEQMSYQEALRWLAKKYNIPIVEREETDEERRQSTEREALFAVNDFAMKHFERNLHDTPDGREIGLAYFTERCLNEDTIRKFHLGYALERPTALYDDAISNGYTKENLLRTGLCAEGQHGVYDRFRGRVIFPVHSMSGKIVAFGGRTLKTDKTVAKYVNSPESAIYSKSRELYGLFQARRAIVKEDCCILVEGYMDVLSMAQSGVENVVASSGTSLTSQQVNIIHRFTNNVIVIYDADAAGIKASLRGVDMLLAEGMKVSVVLFPEGEDPDSFARSHTKQELADYLEENKTDFIRFKTSVLLDERTANDPMERSKAIADILHSIAVIPDPITRQLYIEQSARTFGMDARMLALQVNKEVARISEESYDRRKRNEAAETLRGVDSGTSAAPESTSSSAQPAPEPQPEHLPSPTGHSHLFEFEKALLRYALRYGMLILCDAYDEDSGTPRPFTVLEYINSEFGEDSITISDPTLAALFERLNAEAVNWPARAAQMEMEKQEMRKRMYAEGIEKIRKEATSNSAIAQGEKALGENIDAALEDYERECRREYFRHSFTSDADNLIRRYATDFVTDRYVLSRYHSKFAKVETEEDRLGELVPRCIYELRDAILQMQIKEIEEQLSTTPATDTPRIQQLMKVLIEKTRLRTVFAGYLGERIVTPRRR